MAKTTKRNAKTARGETPEQRHRREWHRQLQRQLRQQRGIQRTAKQLKRAVVQADDALAELGAFLTNDQRTNDDTGRRESTTEPTTREVARDAVSKYREKRPTAEDLTRRIARGTFINPVEEAAGSESGR